MSIKEYLGLGPTQTEGERMPLQVLLPTMFATMLLCVVLVRLVVPNLFGTFLGTFVGGWLGFDVAHKVERYRGRKDH